MEHLRLVLKTLQQYQFFANKKKCEFGRKEIHYLGPVISKEGVHMDPQKIVAVERWRIPRNIKSLRGLLGLTSYNR